MIVIYEVHVIVNLHLTSSSGLNYTKHDYIDDRMMYFKYINSIAKTDVLMRRSKLHKNNRKISIAMQMWLIGTQAATARRQKSRWRSISTKWPLAHWIPSRLNFFFQWPFLL